MRRNRLGKAISAGLLALSIVGAAAFANVGGVVTAHAAVHTLTVDEDGGTVEWIVTVGDTINVNLTNDTRTAGIDIESYQLSPTGFYSISPIDGVVAIGTTVTFNLVGSAQSSGVIRLPIYNYGSRYSEITIYLTVVDGSGNILGTRPWVDNTGGGTGTGTGAGAGADNNSGSGSSGDVPPHVHSFTWKKTQDPTPDNDGEEVYICEGCGTITQRRGLSAMGAFDNENANKILKAAPGATIYIETTHWNTLGRAMRDALLKRRDVTVKFSFLSEGHKGMPLKLTFPAGCDIESLFDEEGYCGLCNAAVILGGYDQ